MPAEPVKNEEMLKQTIWETVKALNRTWTVEGKPERLAEYFAEEMIAITPTDSFRREGRAACIEGWTQFVRSTKILKFEERNPLIVLLAGGEACVVAYDFFIAYEVGGQLVEMEGRDLFTMERRQGRYWLVADQFSPRPQSGCLSSGPA